MIRLIKYFMLMCLMTTACLAYAAGTKTKKALPPPPPRLIEAVESLSGYKVDAHTLFSLDSGGLPSIQLSPFVFEEDLPETQLIISKRAVILGIYASFIRTNTDSVRVTALPQLLAEGSQVNFLKKYQITVTKTRKDALKDIQRFIPVESLDDLVVKNESGQLVWSDAFNAVYGKRDNRKGVNALYMQLIR